MTDIAQRIQEFELCPLDPETEKRLQDEIENWRKLEKTVEIDISIIKRDNKVIIEKVAIHDEAIRRHDVKQKQMEADAATVKHKVAEIEEVIYTRGKNE